MQKINNIITVFLIILLLIIIISFSTENANLQTEISQINSKLDNLLSKNYHYKKQNDSLKGEIEMCKWTGAREYYKLNKDIK